MLVSLWAVFGALAVCGAAGVPGCVLFAVRGSGAAGLALLAAGMVCAGLAILMFFGCRAATRAILLLTGKMTMWIKGCFIKKEEA